MISSLEVGIFSGGSIEMWRTYVGDGCHFYGVGIEDVCRPYEKPGVEIFEPFDAPKRGTEWQPYFV